MNERATPQWLIDTQNRSWEPEILISGITLTFLFFLPHHIYNFFGMLVQDRGVWQAAPRLLYIVCMMMLNGLKAVLIAHLVLRGMWAGLVGLSYVYPHGVNRDRLPKKEQRDAEFVKPEVLVIRLERVCSLLFSFIFSSVIFVAGLLLLLVPITLVFFLGLDRNTVRTITLFVILPVVMLGLFVFLALLETRFKRTRLKRNLDQSYFPQMLAIYLTNVGRARTFLLFGIFFLLVFAFSRGDISRFSFRNDREPDRRKMSGAVVADPEHYETARDRRRRVDRATLDSLRTTDGRIELFVARYREDDYTVTMLSRVDSLRAKAGVPDSAAFGVADLIAVSIDGTPVDGLAWCFTGHAATGQRGFSAIVPLRGMEPGFHELVIGKHVWSVTGKELLDLRAWARIPFELVSSRALPRGGIE